MSAAYLRRHRVTVPTHLRAYTPDEAATETGLTLDELRRMRERGEGPAYITIGTRTVRYIRVDLDAWSRQRSGPGIAAVTGRFQLPDQWQELE